MCLRSKTLSWQIGKDLKSLLFVSGEKGVFWVRGTNLGNERVPKEKRGLILRVKRKSSMVHCLIFYTH